MAKDQFSAIRTLAKQLGGAVSSCTEFDPNVCSYERSSTEPWQVRPVQGQAFSHQLRLKYRGKQVGILANDEYTSPYVRGSFAVRPLTINRREMVAGFDSLPAPRLTVGKASYPIFTSDGVWCRQDRQLLHSKEVQSLLLSLRLDRQESIHFFRNRINVYLRSPSIQRVLLCLDGIVELSEILEEPEQELDLGQLPRQFHPLVPLIKKFAIDDDADRGEFLNGLSTSRLRDLVEAVAPFIPSINAYLNSFKGHPSEEAAALGRIAECATEAQRLLQQ
jgi:hypothetical protein